MSDPSGYYAINLEGIREFFNEAIDKIQDVAHEINNNTHDWLRQNKFNTLTTLAFGGAGFTRGATKKAIGLAQSQAGKKLLRKVAIKESTRLALKSSALGIITGEVVEMVANPEKWLDKSRFGKNFNVLIEYNRDTTNRLIDNPSYIFNSHFWKGEGIHEAYRKIFPE